MSVEIGRIEIVLSFDDAGDMDTAISLPDQADVPVVVQLGMLELARDTVLHPEA